jgi:hypothetical protein
LGACARRRHADACCESRVEDSYEESETCLCLIFASLAPLLQKVSFLFLCCFLIPSYTPFLRHGGKCRFLFVFFFFLLIAALSHLQIPTYASCASSLHQIFFCFWNRMILHRSNILSFVFFPSANNPMAVYNLFVFLFAYCLACLGLGGGLFWRYTPRCFSLECERISSFELLILFR